MEARFKERAAVGESLEVHIATDICIGCGLCLKAAPHIFDLTAENVSRMKSSVIPASAEQPCRQVAANCPVNAIIVIEQ